MPITEIAFDPDNDEGRAGPEDDVTDISDTLDENGIIDSLIVVEASVYAAAKPEFADAIKEPRPEDPEAKVAQNRKWVVIDGNRRLRAALNKGLSEAPIQLDNNRVGNGADSVTRVIANLRRKAYSPMGEANEYAKLLAGPDKPTNEQVAARVGTSPGNVSKKIALLGLPDEVKTMLAAGTITATDGYTLSKLDDAAIQFEAAKLIADGRGGGSAETAIKRVVARSKAPGRDDDPQDPKLAAFAARDAICMSLIANDDSVAADPATLARYIVRKPSRKYDQILALAHQWMIGAGIGEPIDEPGPFVAAALEEPQVLLALARAMALADEELHARADRRGKWDARAVDHFRRLKAAGYHGTTWDAERAAG